LPAIRYIETRDVSESGRVARIRLLARTVMPNVRYHTDISRPRGDDGAQEEPR